MKRIILISFFLAMSLMLPVTAQSQSMNGIHHGTGPLMPSISHQPMTRQPKVMKSNTSSIQLTAPVTKGTGKALDANQSLLNKAFNSTKSKTPRRLSADNVTGDKIMFMMGYDFNSESGNITLIDDYFQGGWDATVTEESPGVLKASYMYYYLPVTINVNYGAKTAEMEMGTIGTFQWSNTVGSTQYDTTQVVMIVNEDYILNAPNGSLTNIPGSVNDEGSLHFPDGYCYYIIEYCTRTKNGNVYNDTISFRSPFLRDTYLMTPNGKHQYDVIEDLNAISWPDEHNNVYMYQADDTTAVIWNMWARGNQNMVMYIHEDGTMEFPSLQVTQTTDTTYWNENNPELLHYEDYNFAANLLHENDSDYIDLWSASTASTFGTVTPSEITWDASMLCVHISYDGGNTWYWAPITTYYLHNKLTFTDGSQWFENQEVPIEDGLYYRYEDNGTATVIAGETPYSGDIIIPETTVHDGRTYTVTAIDSIAFMNCTELTSVIIGDSVTSIGFRAFSGCTGMTSITIPNSITSIGIRAFMNCSGLTNIDLPNSITSIGDGAFSGCRGLNSVIIPNSITLINNSVFYNCSNLKSVIIGDAVTTIGQTAFIGCEELTDVYIPSSVTTIEYSAFSRCFKMENVHITDLEAWCRINFISMTSNPSTHSGNDEEGANLVLNGELITDLVIPNTITSIGDYAFTNCKSLTSVNVPNSVTSIGKQSFSICPNLNNIIISESVTSISDHAFSNCRALTSISIPSSIKVIENGLFSNCTNLSSIILPNSATTIGPYAFNQCTSLTSIDLPNSVKEIGSNAFCMCTNLTNITLPDSITTISDHLFFPCLSLTSITIPNLVTTIEYQAFYNCRSLTSAIIGKSVSSISKMAFSGCVALTDVTCLAETPPAIEDETTIPSYVTSQATLYVPATSLELYRQAEYWRDFAFIEPIVSSGDANGDGVINISDVTNLINYLLTDNAEGCNLANADVNGDGFINISDVTALINILLQQ